LLRRAWRLRGLRRLYPRADAIVCVSAGVAEDLRRYLTLPAGRITIIHNPIQILAEEPSARLHPWLGDRGQPVILGAGRLSRQKDFMTLLHAFALLSDLPAHRLMIIGEGPERAHLEREAVRLGIAERVTLPGFVTNPRACMAASSLFVLSSAWEGFGNVLVEAMAVGTPVVSTDCPSGPREILQDGALGPLVPVGDAPALARAIRQALLDPVPAERLRARADDFAPERVVVPYLAVLLPQALA
jgi:glycosyltransferase involved in cell wall biosynthesis